MATLADNKRDFLLGQGIAAGDLDRMEKTYYQGLSGLATPEAYSVQDHKRAFFKTFLGLSDVQAGVLSISDLERLYLCKDSSSNLAGCWNNFYALHNAIKTVGTPLFWLDSRFPSGFNAALPADSAQISQWNDLSGNNIHATQSTSSARPLYKRSTVLNTPGILFDGVDDQLEMSVAQINTPFSVYAVVNCLVGGSIKTFFSPGVGVPTGVSMYLDTTAPYVRIWTPPGSASAPLAAQVGPAVITGAWNTTEAYAYANGVQGAQRAGGTGTLGGGAGTTYVGSETANWFNGNIYAIIGYNAVHTIAQRQAIERALGAVFGISVA